MYVKKIKNRSGSVSVIVASKHKGRYKKLTTIGISKDKSEIEQLEQKGWDWIHRRKLSVQPELDLFGDERRVLEREREMTERVLSNIDNILLNGTELILDRVFDRIGFNRVEDTVFRKLVQSRLSFPASKAATVEYLKNHYDDDVDLSKIYRYLDKLNDRHKGLVQDISVRHTMEVLGGHIGVMFYDVTTLYFETDRQDDLRKTGFSKEGRHSNPQVILGLLVSLEGYPLAYCIHEGNKYEGHTMLPVIREFVARYTLDDFIVVADSGLMSSDNINELEAEGCKYIIGSRIKNESEAVKRQILSFDRENGVMHEIDKGHGRRLLVGYSSNRARKDAHNREKGIRRLEKAYRAGHLSKENINRRGYNKFLDMDGSTTVSINYDRIREDERWDGLKGYLTNTLIPTDEVVTAYHNLWNVERAFRIAKSKLEIRPMFHFTRRRIEAHVCICFVALKVYKELERLLKLNHINMSVDKVLNMAKTVTTISIYMPENKTHYVKTMPMKRHKPIEKLFDEDFWGMQ